MALKKKKRGAVSQKAVTAKKGVAKKKKLAAKRPLLPSPPISEKQTEPSDPYERAKWKRERREYWRNRFRKILANLSPGSKVKK
ncbi:MAG: hypothetical protein WAO55_14895 [Candidatus Manganitrophaceae bacterium]